MIVFLINCFCLPLFAQQTADLLLQKALYLEDFSPDIQQAIAEFEQVVAEFPENGKTAATALLHLGKIYEATDLKKAANAYRKLLKNYAIQHKIAAEARQHLNKIAPIGLPPEVKYYFDRVGIDIMSNTSYDGRLLVYTDWATGNLMLKNKYTGKIRQLTTIPAGEKFMYDTHARWSKDDRFIAFSRYVAPYHIELRLYSMKENHHRAVLSKPGWNIYPQDIATDNKIVLCQVVETGIEKNGIYEPDVVVFDGGLYWIDVHSKTTEKLDEINEGFYGATISPNEQYVAFNNNENGQSKIYVYNLTSKTLNEVLPSWTHIRFQAEEPVWLTNDILLFRGFITNEPRALYKIKIRHGVGEGEPVLIWPDMKRVPFVVTGIDQETHFVQQKIKIPAFNANLFDSFREDFNTTSLKPPWFVIHWIQPSLMDVHDFGRYNLTERLGYLRFYDSPSTYQSDISNFLPLLSPSFYWIYPGQVISRYLSGHFWRLETKITFGFPGGTQGRSFGFHIKFFNKNDSSGGIGFIRYSREHPTTDYLRIYLVDSKLQVQYYDPKNNWLSPEDTPENPVGTYYFRFIRRGTFMKAEISYDGVSYFDAVSGNMHEDFLDAEQRLEIDGGSWFIPARSYMDIDYVYFTVLDENGNEIKDVR